MDIISAFVTVLKQRNRFRFGIAYTIVALLLNPISALGAEPEMLPAKFVKGEASVNNRLKQNLPVDIKDEDIKVNIYCQTLIGPDGMASNTHCIQPQEHASFGEATRAAVNGAEFMPARIDGEPVSVLMNLIAAVRCKDITTCEVFLLPNHGHNMEKFGLDYSAPQPVLNEHVWYEKFEGKLEWSNGIKTHEEVGGIKFLVSTSVNVSGEGSHGRVEHVESVSREYALWATKTALSLNDVNFIPGHYLGKPIDMRLYEYGIDPESKPYVPQRGMARYHSGWGRWNTIAHIQSESPRIAIPPYPNTLSN